MPRARKINPDLISETRALEQRLKAVRNWLKAQQEAVEFGDMLHSRRMTKLIKNRLRAERRSRTRTNPLPCKGRA